MIGNSARTLREVAALGRDDCVCVCMGGDYMYGTCITRVNSFCIQNSTYIHISKIDLYFETEIETFSVTADYFDSLAYCTVLYTIYNRCSQKSPAYVSRPPLHYSW